MPHHFAKCELYAPSFSCEEVLSFISESLRNSSVTLGLVVHLAFFEPKSSSFTVSLITPIDISLRFCGHILRHGHVLYLCVL